MKNRDAIRMTRGSACRQNGICKVSALKLLVVAVPHIPARLDSKWSVQMECRFQWQ